MTVADLADLHLPGPELGVLSGCATAAPAASLLDEAIHPAAAMQLAGYRHVIATLWSMYDFAGPRLAAALYGQLTAGGRPNADAAPYALHQAAESLRRRHPTHPGVWAPFAHFGP